MNDLRLSLTWNVLALVSWYRQFIKSYSTLPALLTALIKIKRESKKVRLKYEAKRYSNDDTPILASIDFSKLFTLKCDAQMQALSVAEKKQRLPSKNIWQFGTEEFRRYIQGSAF